MQSTQRTALLTALACARARRPELAVKFFKDPKNYGLFPSRRALHGLLLRVGTDVKSDPSKLALGKRSRRRHRLAARSIDLRWCSPIPELASLVFACTANEILELFPLHKHTPTAFTRACLLRAQLHAGTPEGLAASVELLNQPTTAADIAEEATFAFWVSKLLKVLSESSGPEAKDMLTKVTDRLKEVKAQRSKDFPPALDALLS